MIEFDKALFAEYAALKASIASHPSGIVIDTINGSVFIDKLKPHKLDADDFLFA